MIVCLAGGCGSGGKQGTSTTTRTTTSAGSDHHSAIAASGPVNSGAGRAGSTPAHHSPATTSAPPARVHEHKNKTNRVASTVSASARELSALARAEKSCRSPAELTNASLVCQLLAASHHDKALARLLGAGLPSR
jgi:hypothetical protein